MSNWEDYVRRVEPYVPGEQPKKEHMIKLNTNENPYPPAPGVVKALREMNTDLLRRYPQPDCKILVDAIAEFYGVKSEQVFVGVGSDDVLAMIFLTFFNQEIFIQCLCLIRNPKHLCPYRIPCRRLQSWQQNISFRADKKGRIGKNE